MGINMKCPNDESPLVEKNGEYRCPLCPYGVPPNHKILKELYAWVSVDPNGLEGFMAGNFGTPESNANMMLCHSDLKLALRLRSIAEDAIRQLPGYKTKLVRFSTREDVRL